MEHWAKKFFEKITPKHVQNNVWALLGTILGIYGILKIFWFFKKLFEDSTLHGTPGKKYFRKIYPQNMFGNDFARFWNFENFLIF